MKESRNSVDHHNPDIEELKKQFGGKYKSKNSLLNYFLDNFYKDISKLVSSFGEKDKILEVGCGLGESTLRIRSMLRGQYLEASEYEEKLVLMLRNNNFPVKISQESVYALHRQDDEFDHVIILEVLEHLQDYRTALKEIFRVARKSVIISVPNEPLWRVENMVRGKYLDAWGNTPGHINHWNKSSLGRLVSEFGTIREIFQPFPWIILHVNPKK